MFEHFVLVYTVLSIKCCFSSFHCTLNWFTTVAFWEKRDPTAAVFGTESKESCFMGTMLTSFSCGREMDRQKGVMEKSGLIRMNIMESFTVKYRNQKMCLRRQFSNIVSDVNLPYTFWSPSLQGQKERIVCLQRMVWSTTHNVVVNTEPLIGFVHWKFQVKVKLNFKSLYSISICEIQFQIVQAIQFEHFKSRLLNLD